MYIMYFGPHNAPDAHMSPFDKNDSSGNNNHKQSYCCQWSEQSSIETGTAAEKLTLLTIILLQARLIAPGNEGHMSALI